MDFHRSDSEGALCARLVSSFPLSRWEDWRLVHLCCFGGAVTRLLEHSRVQTYESPWMAAADTRRARASENFWARCPREGFVIIAILAALVVIAVSLMARFVKGKSGTAD